MSSALAHIIAARQREPGSNQSSVRCTHPARSIQNRVGDNSRSNRLIGCQSAVPQYIEYPSKRFQALDVNNNLEKLHQTAVVITGFDRAPLMAAWQRTLRASVTDSQHHLHRGLTWSEIQEPPDKLFITLWDTRFLKQFGNAIRGLECIEAAGSPVTFEVTGFTVSSKAPRANVRLLGLQSELDGTLVLAVRKPHIPLHSKRLHYGQNSANVDCSTNYRMTARYKGRDLAELKYSGEHMGSMGRGEVVDEDVPLQRPLRLRGHIEVVRA